LIKRQIYSLLWLPDDRQGFIPPAVRLALRLHRERPYDVMVSTAPPQSLHLCGLILSRLRNLPWVMEYRDPWQGGKAANVVTWWSGALEARWEAAALRRAAAVVTVTDALAAVLRERVADPGKVVSVLNGIPSAHPPRRAAPTGTFQILHAGTVYSRRDPRPLFRALKIVKQRLGPVGRPFVVDFVGLSWQYQGRSLEDWAEEEGVGDLVNLHHAVGYAECQGMIGGADLLLLLAQNQPLQIPNKLYDYLAAGRPILALLDEQGESARLLRKAGDHLLVPVEATAGQIAGVLESAIRRPSPVITDPAVLREWSVENQISRLAEVVEGASLRAPVQRS
jgi:glycosyltransferase involved in cell wall biosynthesis